MSVVSTKIPFKGTGKEYIGDDISEIASAVKVGHLSVCFLPVLSPAYDKFMAPHNMLFLFQSSIQQCCVQLKSKIVKKIQAREQQERKRNLSK